MRARLQSFLMPALIIIALSILSACDKEADSGPADVRWDREVCERCLMAVGDRRFAAQVRGGASDEQQKLYKFDDLGCAVIWLDQQSWRDNPEVEIWVNDFNTEQWIDARSAAYVPDQLSPMNYGLGAQLQSNAGSLSFEQAREHIYKIEEQYNLHNGTLHTTPFDPRQAQSDNQAPIE